MFDDGKGFEDHLSASQCISVHLSASHCISVVEETRFGLGSNPKPGFKEDIRPGLYQNPNLDLRAYPRVGSRCISVHLSASQCISVHPGASDRSRIFSGLHTVDLRCAESCEDSENVLCACTFFHFFVELASFSPQRSRGLLPTGGAGKGRRPRHPPLPPFSFFRGCVGKAQY